MKSVQRFCHDSIGEICTTFLSGERWWNMYKLPRQRWLNLYTVFVLSKLLESVQIARQGWWNMYNIFFFFFAETTLVESKQIA